MKRKADNMVYVVSLSKEKVDGTDMTWIDIVEKKGKYFHPVGINGWPKMAPNYIAFRYDGKLQGIHYIEDFVITKNWYYDVFGIEGREVEDYHYLYTLGPRIVTSKEIKTGNLFPNGRVWARIDALLTADTIAEARDISKK